MKVLLSAIYPYVFALLLFIVPFDFYVRAWPNILLIVLAVSFPFVVKKADFQKLDKKGVLLFLVFLAILALTTLSKGYIDNNLFVLEKTGLSIALLILFLPISEFKKINNAIIFSSIAAILYSLVKIMMLIKDTGTFDFGNNGNPLDTLLIDRLYLGLLSVLSVVVSVKNLSKIYNSYNKYYLINIIINVLFVLLIAARSAIIILIVLAIIKLIYTRQTKKFYIITVISIVFILGAAFVFNKNIKERFLYEDQYNAEQGFVEKLYKVEPRTVIWECAQKIANVEGVIVTGLGFKNVKERLIDCYKMADINESRRDWFLHRKYNIHNQYLDLYFGGGIFTILAFMLFIGYVFYKNRKNYFKIAILVTILLFGMIEVYFQRQIGAYYFGVVLVFLLVNISKNKIIKT